MKKGEKWKRTLSLFEYYDGNDILNGILQAALVVGSGGNGWAPIHGVDRRQHAHTFLVYCVDCFDLLFPTSYIATDQVAQGQRLIGLRVFHEWASHASR